MCLCDCFRLCWAVSLLRTQWLRAAGPSSLLFGSGIPGGLSSDNWACMVLAGPARPALGNPSWPHSHDWVLGPGCGWDTWVSSTWPFLACALLVLPVACPSSPTVWASLRGSCTSGVKVEAPASLIRHLQSIQGSARYVGEEVRRAGLPHCKESVSVGKGRGRGRWGFCVFVNLLS